MDTNWSYSYHTFWNQSKSYKLANGGEITVNNPQSFNNSLDGLELDDGRIVKLFEPEVDIKMGDKFFIDAYGNTEEVIIAKTSHSGQVWLISLHNGYNWADAITPKQYMNITKDEFIKMLGYCGNNFTSIYKTKH